MIVYVQVSSMIFTAKCLKITRFFLCLCSALMEKHDLYCSVNP
jgi:hypothetical protein